MITSAEELQASRDQVRRLEESVSELRIRLLPHNADRFKLFAESYVSEIEKLRSLMDEYLGLTAARQASTDFIARIVSPNAESGEAPSKLVSKILNAVQRGMQSLGEYVAFAGSGVEEPAVRFGRLLEVQVVALTFGSFQIGMRVSEPVQLPISPLADTVKRFSIALATAVQQPSPTALHTLLPDLNLQLRVLQAFKDMSPSDEESGYSLEISGRYLTESPIRLTAETRSYLADAIKDQKLNAEEIGIVREIDLDRRTLQIKFGLRTLRCTYVKRLEDRIKDTLDRRVKIRGVAVTSMSGNLKVFRIKELTILQ